MGKFKIGKDVHDRMMHLLKSVKENKPAQMMKEEVDILPSNLREGVPTYRSSPEGIMQYVKVNGKIYQTKLEEYQGDSSPLMKPDFDTGWIEVDYDTNFFVRHNLESKLILMQWYAWDKHGSRNYDNNGNYSATNQIFSVSHNVVDAYHPLNSGSNDFQTMFNIEMYDDNQIRVGTGNDAIMVADNVPSTTSRRWRKLEMRMLAWKTGVVE
tara:strand:+ start:231 stop:863 length:633 start_codon:yes stop_codon:yes gene_type:complete